MTRVTPRFVMPWTRSPPAFHTRPFPALRFFAYCMEIMASSHRQNTRESPCEKLVR